MVKVLHLNASAGGGAFVVANRLNNALNKSGKVDSNHLVFTDDSGDDYVLWANTSIKRKIAFGLHAAEKLDFLRFEKDRSVRFAFSHGRTGVSLLDHPLVKQADILHLHWINKGFISLNGLEKLYKSGKKIIWTAHDLWPFTGGCYHPRGCENYHTGCGNCKYLKRPDEKDLSFLGMQKKLSIYQKHNPLITVPGQWSLKMAEKSRVAEYIRLEHIGNFIDTDFFMPATNPNTGGNKKFRIVFSSMNLLNPQKGIFDLAEAIQHMPDNDRFEIELVLVGNAKYELPEFKCDVVRKGVITDQKEMADIYQSADLMVVPSYEETFGLTVAESQSCGIPVVAYSAGELAYNVVHNETGMLCNAGDVKVLMENILYMKNMDTDERMLFGSRAREFAVNKFNSGNSVNQYLFLYAKELGIDSL